jgi:hypothetical protein
MSWFRPPFRWFTRGKQPAPCRTERWFQPCLERLEDRLAPATFTVSNVSDSGTGSLRQAILDVNASTDTTNTINFALSGSGLQTIVPQSPLPTITRPVVLDGYTQSGASTNTLTSGDNAALMVELDGSEAGTTASGLTLAAANSIIRGLLIDNFGGQASPSAARRPTTIPSRATSSVPTPAAPGRWPTAQASSSPVAPLAMSSAGRPRWIATSSPATPRRACCSPTAAPQTT